MPEDGKQKTENRKPLLRICVPVVEATVNRARGRYQRAARKGLWTEIRLDYLEEPAPDLQKLFRSLPGPVIATNRLAAEGGRWTGTEAGRLALLEKALNLGSVEVDGQYAVGAGSGEKVSYQSSGDRHSGLVFLISARVAIVRHDGSDSAG